MSENQNVLEPLVDCILESGILMWTTIIKAVSNLSVFLLKTSWDGIESISNALYKKITIIYTTPMTTLLS